MSSFDKRWRALAASAVSDAVTGGSGLGCDIRCLVPLARTAGPAATVMTAPGDFLSVGRAISDCPPGSVLVVATGGDRSRAYAGANMVQLMVNQKLAGLVIDGCIRDLDDVIKLGFPVFGYGTTPRAADFSTEGRANVPIAIGGTIVEPGDWIVADSDGVTVVAKENAKEILKLAEGLAAEDEETLARCADGATWQELFENGDAR